MLAAWQLFHAGEFQKAAEAGLKLHAAGAGGALTVANKAQAIYATYLEKQREDQAGAPARGRRARREARRTRSRRKPTPGTAWPMRSAATARASASPRRWRRGSARKVKNALETTIKLAPKHADAHIALGAFHAEVIDKVGSLLGLTQGASKDAGLAHYKTALKLNPSSAIAMIEYANGLVMLEGEKRMKEATKLYEDAAACEPLDATERLDVEMAKAELED